MNLGDVELSGLDHGGCGVAGEVGREEGRLGICSRGFGGFDGFLLEDIQGGTGEKAQVEGVDEVWFMDDLASAGIEEVGVGFHFVEEGGVEEVAGFGGVGEVHGDDVGLGEEFIE